MKILIIGLCLAFAACGEPVQEQAHEDEAHEVRDTAFEPLTDQLDRAKAVEDTLEQHKRDLDAALEKAEDER